MKLSDKAELLLGIVREGTKFADNGALVHYFVPSTRPIYSVYGTDLGPYGYRVQGASDANAFRSLERKGLIKSQTVAPYAYYVTEDGIVEYEKIAERRRKEGK